MRNLIIAKIDQRRARLLELERERLILQGELSAYEDALRYFPPDNPQPVDNDAAPAPKAAQEERQVRRRRRIAEPWADALRQVCPTVNATFSIDAIMRAVMTHGITPTRGNVRSQMAAYIERGIVDRVSDGQFRLTDAGIAELERLPLDRDEAADHPLGAGSAASTSDHNQHREGDAGGGI
jgi:uncharacterized protein with von Willebrand factor type A (vWA) domain